MYFVVVVYMYHCYCCIVFHTCIVLSLYSGIIVHVLLSLYMYFVIVVYMYHCYCCIVLSLYMYSVIVMYM